MIEFRPYLEEFHKREVYKWFDEKEFYYDTYMPDKIMEYEIEQLLGYYESYTTVIVVDKRLVGLCDFIIEHEVAKIEFRIAKHETVDQQMEQFILYSYCKKIFDNYSVRKISKFVYAFDEWGQNLFSRMNFYKEGEYANYIYKDYNYWNVSVYSVFRGEFEHIKGVQE